jgi:V/A-type H+-transporting ATPase subunit D
MPVKHPPGRAGRLWLVRRLEAARRGADVLDQKRQALLRERTRLAELLVSAGDEWTRCAREAVDSNARALAIVGERRLRLAAVHCRECAEVLIVRRNILGTASPRIEAVSLPEQKDLVALGGTSVAIAAAAHGRALEAAAAFAAVHAAHAAVTEELAATNRRLRAIERRWIPQHEQALARLELVLDENERDDISRVRWALESRDVRE